MPVKWARRCRPPMTAAARCSSASPPMRSWSAMTMPFPIRRRPPTCTTKWYWWWRSAVMHRPASWPWPMPMHWSTAMPSAWT
ncbi:hypothetical protein G6F62_013546 [Rhizopus arrhizus]|nr:hypothetical protein G6F62_013546 [Rhizopus arrhizus]